MFFHWPCSSELDVELESGRDRLFQVINKLNLVDYPTGYMRLISANQNLCNPGRNRVSAILSVTHSHMIQGPHLIGCCLSRLGQTAWGSNWRQLKPVKPKFSTCLKTYHCDWVGQNGLECIKIKSTTWLHKPTQLNLKVHNVFLKVTFNPWLRPVKIWLHTVSG